MANPNEKAILNEFQARRTRLQGVQSKLQELQSEVTEHEMVIKTLQPMDAGRKCFRLVGEVLVERTVGETLPAVTRNKDMLEHAIKTLEDTFESLEKEINEFKTKHQIRIVDNQGRSLEAPEPEPEAAGASKKQAGSSKAGQGVLVDVD